MIIRNETTSDIEAISEVTRAAVEPDRSAFKEYYVDSDWHLSAHYAILT